MGKYTKTDTEYYDKEFNRLESIRSASEDLKEERTFDIASGGLALSIGIFTYLSANGKPLPCKWMIILVMALFGVAIVVNYLSHHVSTRAMERNIELVNDRISNKIPYNHLELEEAYVRPNKKISIMNKIVFTLTFVGVVLVVVYGIIYIL